MALFSFFALKRERQFSLNVALFQDDSNRSLLSEKKFSKECIRCCVLQNKTMSTIEVMWESKTDSIFLKNPLNKISIIELLYVEEKTSNSSQNYLADLVPTFYWTQTFSSHYAHIPLHWQFNSSLLGRKHLRVQATSAYFQMKNSWGLQKIASEPLSMHKNFI